MKIVYQKCTDIMGWLIENNKTHIPADIYDNECGSFRDRVTDELRKSPKHFECTFASNRLHTIKSIDTAKYLLAYYMDKTE